MCNANVQPMLHMLACFTCAGLQGNVFFFVHVDDDEASELCWNVWCVWLLPFCMERVSGMGEATK